MCCIDRYPQFGCLVLRWISGLLLLLLIHAGLFPASSRAAVRAVIPVWCYYQHPPFLTGPHAGLSFDFVRLMNVHADGAYRFELVHLPRKRIDQLLAEKKRGVVLFVNWTWMGDESRSRYFWSPLLLSDRNEILSNVIRKIDYTGVESLYGKKLGGVVGRRYGELDLAVKHGDIIREDSPNAELNLKKLVLGRIDCMTAPRSILLNLIRKNGFEAQVYFSPRPLACYTRHILVPLYMPDVFAEIEALLVKLLKDPNWSKLKEKYQVEGQGDDLP